MKTVYDLYHWPRPNSRVEIQRDFTSLETAVDMTGTPFEDGWERTANQDGWILDRETTNRPDTWAVFDRQIAENHAEAVQLALELIAADGQVDGAHHKAWVIDQVTRILAGDGYEQWIADYRDGEDGPETYAWDEGIAP